MKSEKAQSEIVGLVVIVLIVAVAMLIYLSSQAEEAEEQQGIGVQKKYAYNELSISFLDTIVDTSVCSVTVDELVKDCGSRHEIMCDGKTSCEKLNETFISIKNDTLDEWGVSYGLIIDYPSRTGNDMRYVTGNCTPESTGQSAPGYMPIPLEPQGTAIVKLGICNS